MLIQLTDSDLSKMPNVLRKDLLGWLQSMDLDSSLLAQQGDLSLMVMDIAKMEYSNDLDLENHLAFELEDQDKSDCSQIRLSQLFDGGLTRSGMLVRVRLKRERAKKIGRDYINSLTISPRGTVAYGGEEFDKPSPLATKLNGSPANGWEYLEVKREGEWMRLEILRQQLRQAL
ncbi:MAG: hypothetical protein HC781_11760 [Leptolyngbyaceae cyanobacterium CSU_1_4]|nr:hypothetical protein [Leptolyngbyaceae cyanobacterium CSU_1_4]